MRPRTLRGQVTAWLVLVLLAALMLYGTAVYVSLRQILWHELDERLHNDIETLEGLLQSYWDAAGPRADVDKALDDDDLRWMEVWSLDGRRLFATPVAASEPYPAVATSPGDQAYSVPVPGDTLRVKEESGHIGGHPIVVRAITSEARIYEELRDFLWLAGLAIPCVALLAALGGHWLLRRTFRPVDQLLEGARSVRAERLDVRLPVANARDEVGQIAEAFNATLARLEASFEQMRRFTANASHELRTPLAALRATGQAALSGNARDEELREALGDILEDAEQLSRLLNTMMLLAQADAGRLMLERRPCALDALVRDVVAECEVLATDKGQRIVVAVEPARAAVDPVVFRIAVANLLHNAIRYAPAGTDVTVRLTRVAATWQIEVADAGPGIAREHHARLFERFYRVDAGRAHAAGGVGLGLAMARWSAEAHGGRIDLDSAPGSGSTFRVVLPATDEC